MQFGSRLRNFRTKPVRIVACETSPAAPVAPLGTVERFNEPSDHTERCANLGSKASRAILRQAPLDHVRSVAGDIPRGRVLEKSDGSVAAQLVVHSDEL